MMVDKSIHKKLKIQQHETHYKSVVHSGKACRSCLTSGSRRVTLVKNLMKSHERRMKDTIVTKTTGTYQW